MSSQKPLPYKIGWVEFYKLKFKLTPDVLIPRPETELLVDEILAQIKNWQETNSKLDLLIVDIGTGSGNIAISVAKNLLPFSKNERIKIKALDISAKALRIAKLNARLHGVSEKIQFLQSDLISALKPEKQDLILFVTNLPYIPTARIPYLDSSVKDFEPILGLDGGEDGFALYRKLFGQISNLQFSNLGCVIGEIDYTHAELAAFEGNKYFPNALVEVKKDLAHKQRILKITF